eukprot:3395038-Alexandrium_andersonii.AAC.1
MKERDDALNAEILTLRARTYALEAAAPAAASGANAPDDAAERARHEGEVTQLKGDLAAMAAQRDHERGELVKLKTYYLDLMIDEQASAAAAREELTKQ